MKKSPSKNLLSRLALPTLLVGGIAIATGGYVVGTLNASLTPQVTFPTFWQVSSNSSAGTPALPNLLPTAITAVPYQPIINGVPSAVVQIRVQIQSTNNGKAVAAPSSMSFGAIKPDGTSVSFTQPTQELQAGSTATNSFILPGAVTYDKDYTISVCLDTGIAVAESNETDNCAKANVRLNGPVGSSSASNVPPTTSSSRTSVAASSSSRTSLPTTCPLPLNCYVIVAKTGLPFSCAGVQLSGLNCEMFGAYSTYDACQTGVTAALQKACNVSVSLNGRPLTCTAPTGM